MVGARPQFVKAAVVSRALSTCHLEEILVHTGQHYDPNMSDVFFEELELCAPDYSLGISGGSHGMQTGRMLEAIEKVMIDVKPDLCLVYGDTNSTLAAALAAAKLHIPVAHVEAGLRSFDRRMPEEINRLLVDHVSDYLFAPTAVSVRNLQREGVDASKIHLVGDVMYDVALYYGEKAERTGRILETLGLEPGRFILATVHRAENTDNRTNLEAIFSGLAEVATSVPVVVPLHPRTRAVLVKYGLLDRYERALTLIDPVGYLDMLQLQRNACLIATDSGGLQKEAFFHGKLCVTLRLQTEWVELVEAGWNCTLHELSATVVSMAIRQQLERTPPSFKPALYGDGNAALKIAQILSGTTFGTDGQSHDEV